MGETNPVSWCVKTGELTAGYMRGVLSETHPHLILVTPDQEDGSLLILGDVERVFAGRIKAKSKHAVDSVYRIGDRYLDGVDHELIEVLVLK